MSNQKTLSPAVLQASKNAATHRYDTSTYIKRTSIGRDAQTGRLVTADNKK